MKLTNYILDLGRTVAFMPGLKKVTGSVNATLMLCQFLYWSDKTRDGWIYKTSEEIEEETGLSYNEQRTAYTKLEELGLIAKEIKRLDHTTKYQINQARLNQMWEDVSGEKSKPVNEAIPEPVVEIKVEPIPVVVEKPVEPRVAPQKKGDLMDGILNSMTSPTALRIQEKKKIKSELESGLNINTNGIKWEKFIEFAHTRQTKYKENVSTFILWAMNNGFNPVYWTPDKMITLYPQAFAHPEKEEVFIKELPKAKQEEVAPMPRDIGRKNNY